jgi:hypothetical protein
VLLLRVSGESTGRDVDVASVTAGAAAAARSGVAHGEALVAFAEGVAGEDDEALARARAGLLAAMGPAALVDAAGVASNFERMVRIADATGIPLDAPVAALTEGMRRELGIDAFAAAAHTPATGPIARALARALRPLVPTLARLLTRRTGRGGRSYFN